MTTSNFTNRWSQLDEAHGLSMREWDLRYYELARDFARTLESDVLGQFVLDCALKSPFIIFDGKGDNDSIFSEKSMGFLLWLDEMLSEGNLHYIDQIQSGENEDHVSPCIQLFFASDPLIKERYNRLIDLHYERSHGSPNYIPPKLFILGRFIEEATDLYELMARSS